jgi:hypothetical protein
MQSREGKRIEEELNFFPIRAHSCALVDKFLFFGFAENGVSHDKSIS